MRSVMTHRFSEVPNVRIPRSRFNRSHGFKTTFDAGFLVPMYVDICYPGDTFDMDLTGFARLATPTYPIMDNMFMETFFFAVPLRLLWTNWQKFCGEQVDPGDSIDYTCPKVPVNNVSNETLWDYFGLPTKINASYNVNAFASRAYNLIWNEWFRDENLQDSVTVDTGNGPDTPANYVLLRRGKRHDYFTSCLPWLQKGDDVLVSLGTEAPIFGDDMDWDDGENSDNYVQVRDAAGSSANLKMFGIGTNYLFGSSSASGGSSELKVDLSQATGPSVNALRLAIATQHILERDARAGTRYTEILKSHFGVNSPDARVQRPEYLGGGKTPVNVNPIARTDSSPGVLGAMGTVAFSNHGFTKSFSEHCIIIGLVTVTADLTYQEGIERHWSDDTRYDFYWPDMANLGEQAVLNKEIYIDATTIGVSDTDVFGYQERWAHLRYKPSKITGKFRSNDAASLEAWHLGIEFGSEPTLDSTFIVDNPPIDRVIATPSEPHFIYDSYAQLMCTRPMPTYSVPGLSRL